MFDYFINLALIKVSINHNIKSNISSYFLWLLVRCLFCLFVNVSLIFPELTKKCEVSDVKKLNFENYDESIVKMLPGDEIDMEVKDEKRYKKKESIQKSIM